ncbi:hypothetical protein EK21DRAFT_118203 [Setomelanomma holmii]|uniref:Uncharacterized protein n=1 Tax=Setomelanomma holmii TaxID=210430 RepID=A0A9P4GYT8_9PLEO|nr:hypothetical protein EK21DRAFT_118203 [Setomelanomma holmii]
MHLQRQNIISSNFDVPQTVAFVLPGRRTLSENLPAESVVVLNSIAKRSRYLCNLIEQHASQKPKAWQIALHRIDCMGFRFYIEWLRNGHIEFNANASKAAGSGLLLRDCFDLIFAHIVGAQFDEPSFQDYIVDIMTSSLDASQTPDLKVLEVVFLEKGATPVLQRFVVDRMFAVERRMLGMIRGSVDAPAIGTAGCEYHVHGDEQCYKTDAKYACMPTANALSTKNACHTDSSVGTQTAADSHCPSISSIEEADTWKCVSPRMSKELYFSSAEWSRKVHGLRPRPCTPAWRSKKPLPAIPPLRAGSSPSTPSSPSLVLFSERGVTVELPSVPSPQSSSLRSHTEPFGTQQLVLECLARLTHDTPSSALPLDLSSPMNTIPIRELVLECLERLKSAPSGSTSSAQSLSSSSDESSPRHSAESSPLTSKDENIPPLQSAYHHARYEESYDELPVSSLHHPDLTQRHTSKSKHNELISTSPSPPRIPTSYLSSPEPTQSSHGLPSIPSLSPAPPSCIPLLHPAPSIKRKPAPPRGTDWLKQYDCINTMMRNTPAHNLVQPAKRSKTAKFREMLKSESAIGRLEGEASVVVRKGGRIEGGEREGEREEVVEMMPRWA